MIGAALRLLGRSSLAQYILASLALLGGVGIYGSAQRRRGRRAAETDRRIETLETIRRMQHAARNVPTDRQSIANRMRRGQF